MSGKVRVRVRVLEETPSMQEVKIFPGITQMVLELWHGYSPRQPSHGQEWDTLRSNEAEKAYHQ